MTHWMREITTMDQIILKWLDGFHNPSDPLWGQFQTFVLDIDNRQHLLWLKKQYKSGAVLLHHSYTKAHHDPTLIHHIPTEY